MTAAINYSVPLFTNVYEGARQVIDVTGDGAESEVWSEINPICPPLQAARDNALASGVDTINALFVENHDWFGVAPTDYVNAIDYGNNNVIGGTGAFVNIVSSFDQFAPAVLEKIGREIQPTVIPAPGAIVLGSIGVAFVGWLRRRRTL